MNPLTLVKRIQQINSKEAALGISEGASWHTKYQDSAYVFVGGIPFDLTEGDLLAVFAQYGEIVDVNLVRDKATGKSKGYCFIAYEDQRSTNLAVDNLNGANVLGRIIRVDHKSSYKKKEEEDEEEEQKKREERGVCRAFQRGECKYGASCKFSHNEQRSANTGWGAKEDSSSKRWAQDKYEPPAKSHRNPDISSSDRMPEPQRRASGFNADDKIGRSSKSEYNEGNKHINDKRTEMSSRNQERRGTEKRSEKYERDTSHKDRDNLVTERSLRRESELSLKEDLDKRRRHESEQNPRGDRGDRGKEERSNRYESEPNRKDWLQRDGEKRPRYDRDSSYHHKREEDNHNHRSDR